MKSNTKIGLVGVSILAVILLGIILISNQPVLGEEIPQRNVTLEETDTYYRLSNNYTGVEIYKGTSGYNVYYDMDFEEIKIYNERVFLEYKHQTKWKQIGIAQSTELIELDNGYSVVRHFTDFIGTDYDVIYTLEKGTPLKMSINMSGSERKYRVNWDLNGIAGEKQFQSDTKYIYGENINEWSVIIDYGDVIQSFGNITSYETTTTAQGRKANFYFLIGVTDGFTLDPSILSEYTGTGGFLWYYAATSNQSMLIREPYGFVFYNASVIVKKYNSPDCNSTIIFVTDDGTGKPNVSNVLATGSNFTDDMSSSYHWENITFNQTMNASANTNYWVVFFAIGCSGTNGYAFDMINSNADDYTNSLVEQLGGVWTQYNYDFRYKIYGEWYVTINLPTNTTYDTQNVELNVTTLYPYEDIVWYSLDEGANTTLCTSCNGDNTTLSGLSKGLHNVSVYANDTSNNIEKNFGEFTVDETPPSITIDQPTNNTYHAGNSTDDLLINVTASDTYLDSCYTNSTYFTQILTSGFNFTNISSLTEGLHDIMIYCNDTLNNTGSAEVYFYYDITKPAILITSPQNISYNYTGIAVNWDSNETYVWAGYELNGASNVSISAVNDTEYQISLTGGAYWGSGAPSYRCYDEDWGTAGAHQGGSGNKATALENTTLDVTNSSDNLTWGFKWGIHETTTYFQVSIYSYWDSTWDLIFDSSGTSGTSTETISLSYAEYMEEGAKLLQTKTVWWISTEGSGFGYYYEGKVYIDIQNTTITAQESSNTLYVWANDTAGNMNYSKVVFFVDSIYPSITINQPINDSYQIGNSTGDVLINVTANDTNLDSCYTNSTYFTQILTSGFNFTNTSSLPNAVIDIIVYCNDTINNTNSSEVYFNYKTFNYTNNSESIIPSNITVDEYIKIKFNVSSVTYEGYVNLTIPHLESQVNSTSLVVKNTTGDNVTSAKIEDNRIIFYVNETEDPYYVNYSVKLIDEMTVSEYGNCSTGYNSFLDNYCRKRTSDASYFYYSIQKYINVSDNFSKDYKITFVVSKGELMEWSLAESISISVNSSATNMTYSNIDDSIEIVIDTNHTGINTSLHKGTYFVEMNYSVKKTSSPPSIGQKGGGDIYYPVCGNGFCDYNEDEINCPQDCLIIKISFSISPVEIKIQGTPGSVWRKKINILNPTKTNLNIMAQVNDISCDWISILDENNMKVKNLIINVSTDKDKINFQTITVIIDIPERPKSIVSIDYIANILFSTQGYQVELPINIYVQEDILFRIVSFANIQLPAFPKPVIGITGIPLWFWFSVLGIVGFVGICRKKRRILWKGGRNRENRW